MYVCAQRYIHIQTCRIPDVLSATGLEAGTAISACGPAQCHASFEPDSRHKPFKTRFDAIAKQNKTICEPAGRFLNSKKPLLLTSRLEF